MNHVITLINNTFAWNVCGIWTGQINPAPAPSLLDPSLGLSLLCLVNNVFDSSPPLDFSSGSLPLELPLAGRPVPNAVTRWINAVTAALPGGSTLLSPNRMTNFEGVDRDDLLSASVNFNGVELRKWNVSTLLTGLGTLQQSSIDQLTFLGLHQTGERNGRAPNPVVERDLSRYTGLGTQQRGILFVRDLLHEGSRSTGAPFNPPGATAFDLGAFDFRLSPGGRTAGVVAGAAPQEINFFVDRGFTFQRNPTTGVPVPLLMDNSIPATPDPFDLGEDRPSFPFTPWDWDCEGFGNPHTFEHPLYPSVPGTPATKADLGADELDLLIIAGYRIWTTTFERDSNVNPPQENDFAWFLAASETLPGVDTGVVASGMVPAIAPGSAILGPFHSDYLPTAWTKAVPATYYQPKFVDVVPHLLPDIHPWSSLSPTTFPTNVIWQPCAPYASVRNIFLYMNPSFGIINPVGTYHHLYPTSAGTNWLDTDLLIAMNAPSTLPLLWMDENAATPPPPNTSGLTNSMAASGGFCFLSDPTAGVTFLRPSQNPRFSTVSAMRVSCEFVIASTPWMNIAGIAGRGSNLQTFLAVKGQ